MTIVLEAVSARYEPGLVEATVITGMPKSSESKPTTSARLPAWAKSRVSFGKPLAEHPLG